MSDPEKIIPDPQHCNKSPKINVLERMEDQLNVDQLRVFNIHLQVSFPAKILSTCKTRIGNRRLVLLINNKKHQTTKLVNSKMKQMKAAFRN